MTMPSWFRAGSYAASKLGAAGAVFAGFLLVLGGNDWYGMSEMTREIPFWFFFYVYAIAYSVIVDLLVIKVKQKPARPALVMLLYLLGGFAPMWFLFQEAWMLSLIAGFVGVACSIAFLGATLLFRRLWPYNGVAALLLLAGVIYVHIADFTEKAGWKETRLADEYHAAFDYFHGRHHIPVHLQAGETLAYRVDWRASGGHGTYLDTKGVNGANVGSGHRGEGWMAYKTEEASSVCIVVTGDRATGALTVRWTITDEEQQIRDAANMMESRLAE